MHFQNTQKGLIKTYFILLISIFFVLNVHCEPKINTSENISTGYQDSILKVSTDGVFMRNGKAYYGIGVNYFNAFYRTILSNNDISYTAGLKYLSENKIPFIRFSINGFWPNELKLYRDNKPIYFTLLDEFVKSAETNGVGLIPSLFWNSTAVPDLVGEHVNQWANPNSKTIAFMRTYTTEIVNRYKNSPAIWGWEFSNEMNCVSDLLSQAINFLPKVSVSQGTPATRTIEDAMTTDILLSALNDFEATVRKIDPDRAIFCGNGMPPANMYHRYKFQTWTQDSSTDFTTLLDLQNPISFGSLTLHVYPEFEFKYFSDVNASYFRMIQEAMRSAKELKRPLFIGEFGSPKTLGTEMEAQKFNEALKALIDNKVQLSALWVYDFSYQDADWNITQTNSRKYQLDAIINANAQFLITAGNIETISQNGSYSLYTNPTNDVVQLKVETTTSVTSSMCYQLYDMQGRFLETNKIVSELTNIDVENLVPSIYFLKIINDNKEVKVFKIIKI